MNNRQRKRFIRETTRRARRKANLNHRGVWLQKGEVKRTVSVNQVWPEGTASFDKKLFESIRTIGR